MTYLALIHDPTVCVASDKLVIPAAELASLKNAVELGENLAHLLFQEQGRIDSAERQGYEKGYKQGRAEGLQQGLEQLSDSLVELVERVDQLHSQLQVSAVKIAIQIVRKIAVEVGEQAMVVSLAETAVQELLPSGKLVVKVHPDLWETVAERLNALQKNLSHPHMEVRTDDTLALFDCVLDTEHGSVIAGLETQLANLGKALLSEVNDPAGEPPP